MIATRPFNWDASDAADEALYAANAGNPALFDADGNRKKLDPKNPDHLDLIKEWFVLYAEHGGEVEDPNVPPKDPPDKPVKPCEDDELILVSLKERVEVNTIVGEKILSDYYWGDNPMVDRRQYINEAAREIAKDGDSNRSRKISLVAQLAWKSGKTVDLVGHKVAFTFEALPGNRENLDFPLKESPQEGTPIIVASDADGLTEIAELRLSQYGGDRFRIHATLKTGGTGELQTGVFTVWRRMHYIIHTMRKADGTKRPEHNFDYKFFETFDRRFLEFVGPEIPDAHPAHRRMITTSDDDKYIHDNSLIRKPGNRIQFIFCEHVAADPEENEGDVPTAKSIIKQTWLPKDRVVIAPNLHSIMEAKWRHKGGEWHPFPLSRIQLDPHFAHEAKLTFDTDGLPDKKPLRSIQVRIKFRVYRAVGGFEADGDLFIRTSNLNMSTKVDRLRGVCIHEAGHAMGLAAKKTPEGTENAFVLDWAGHCSFGDKACIMYRSSSSAEDYCEVCADALRARRLSNMPEATYSSY